MGLASRRCAAWLEVGHMVFTVFIFNGCATMSVPAHERLSRHVRANHLNFPTTLETTPT